MIGAVFHMRNLHCLQRGHLFFKLYDYETATAIDCFLWLPALFNRF